VVRRRPGRPAARRLLGLAAGAAILLVAAGAAADGLRVVVRHAGGADDLAVERLAGHVVDLDVEPIAWAGALEPHLDAQIAAAPALARRHDATAVVWFHPAGAALLVVVATPGDRRVFVREIDAGTASATAEAAAQAARTAIRAIALGGTIGVELPPDVDVEAEPEPEALRPPRLRWHGGVGWQVAVDRGADLGAHAAWQRLGAARGGWGAALALSVGPPLRRDGEVVVRLSRSALLAVGEHHRGPWRLGLGVGPVLSPRATVEVPAGLEATGNQAQLAVALAPEVRWQLRPGRGAWGIEVVAGLDVVVGAPELAVDREGAVEILAKITTLQPRLGVGLVVGP
jgi:hypothetical protein